MNTWDNVGFHLLNHMAGHYPGLDKAMEFFAQYALELYALLFLLAWLLLPKEEEVRRHALVVAGLSGLLALLFNVLISHIWFRPRPFAIFPHGTFIQLVPHAQDASFPSDHAAGTFAFAGASWGRSTSWVSYSFTTLAVLVMMARVYVGVHWPTDVLAGMVVGILSGRLMWTASRWIQPLTSVGLRLFHYGRFASPPTKYIQQ